MSKTNQTQNGIVRTRAHELADKVETIAPLDGEPTYQHFRTNTLRSRPYRAPQYLEWLWERYDSIQEASERTDCAPSTLSKWLAVFGLREREPKRGFDHASHIRKNVDPEDLGLEPHPEEGSA